MKKILLLIILFFVTNFYSQSKQEKIKELIALSGVFNMSEEVKNQFMLEFKKRYPHVPETEWKQISTKIDANELINQNIEIYGKYFSENEIDDLLKFYKTDLGKKLMKNSIGISNEIRGNSVKWVEKITKDINMNLEKDGYLQSPPPPMNSSSPPPPKKW